MKKIFVLLLIALSVGIRQTNAQTISSDSTTTVTFTKSDDLKIYPNPITTIATITYGTDFEGIIYILSIVGKEEREIKMYDGKAIFYRGDMQPGVYFVQLMKDGQKIITKKVTIKD